MITLSDGVSANYVFSVQKFTFFSEAELHQQLQLLNATLS